MYWGRQLKISIALNPKKNCNYCNPQTEEYRNEQLYYVLYYLSMVVADCHADAVVQHGVHRLMEHIQGFAQSHWNWTPPLGECLRRIHGQRIH
jgi:hypothetical protein